MYLSFSKTIAKFGCFRLRVGGRVTKKNAGYMWLAVLFWGILKMSWYLLIAIGWLFYAMGYGIYWCVKKIVSACKKKGNSPVSEQNAYTHTSVTPNDDSMTEEDKCVSDISSSPQPGGKPPKSKADIVRWVIGGFFALCLTATGLHYSSIFIIASAFLMFPFGFVKSFLAKKNIKTTLVIVFSVVLFAVGAVTSPLSEDAPHMSDDKDYIESNGESNKDDENANNSNSQNSPTNGGALTDNNNDNNDDVENTPSEEENTGDGSSDTEQETPPANESSEPDEPLTKIYSVTYSHRIIEKNYVGNEWSYGISLNGENIKSASNITIPSNTTIVFTAYATEADSGTDDYGSENIAFSHLQLGENQTKSVVVSVIENDGSHKGKVAKIEFTVVIRRVE